MLKAARLHTLGKHVVPQKEPTGLGLWFGNLGGGSKEQGFTLGWVLSGGGENSLLVDYNTSHLEQRRAELRPSPGKQRR